MKKHYNLKALTQGVKAFAALLMVMIITVGSLFAQTSYSHTIGAKTWSAFGAQTLSNVEWTAAGSSTTYFGYDATKGQQFGSGGSPCAELSLSTTAIEGTVTSVKVNTSGASSVNADFKVKVGGTYFTCNGNESISLTKNATDYTFTGSNSGEIRLEWAQTSSKALYVKSIEVTYIPAPVAVAAPLLTPGTGTYYVPQTVSISAQNGATIYYTIDGTIPTENSTVYTEPFVVNATTTVKAIAVDGEDVSNVTTAVYTVTLPIEVANIAAFKAVDNTTNIYKITGDVTVIGQYSNKYHTFIQDNTGALYIYGTMANAYNPGDVISGGVCGNYSLYNGLIEMKPAGPAAAEGTPGTAIEPIVVTLAELISNYADYEGKLVTVIGATAAQDRTFGTSSATKGANITQGDATVQIYNTWGAITNKEIATGDVLNVTGYVIRYNNTVEIVPRGAEDIIMAVAELPYTLDFDNNVDDGFAIDNATATNKWYIGQASDFDNNKLFISNNGATNKYTNDASTAYASRTLRIPAAGALLSFDYRVMGEGNYDNLTVSIMKDGEATVLATLNNTNEWTNASYVIDPSLAGVVDLVFTWKNDNSGAYQFPAAVDNISVIENPCAQPTNLAAAVSGTTATITWTPGAGQNAWIVEYKPTDHSEWHSVSATTPSVTLANLTGNTDYNVRVKANCGSSSSIWTNANFAIDCQTLVVGDPEDIIMGTGTSTTSNYIWPGYYGWQYSAHLYDMEQYGQVNSIALYLNASSSSSGTMTIWVKEVDNDFAFASSNTFDQFTNGAQEIFDGAPNTSQAGWVEFPINNFTLTEGKDLLVIIRGVGCSISGGCSKSARYTSTTSKMWYKSKDSSDPGFNTTGTVSSYRANLKINMTSEVCGDVPACTEPTNLTVSNVTTNSAEIAWNAGADETAWTVEYRPAASENWTVAQTTENNYVLNGLNTNTPYVVRVAADCGTTTSEYVAANFTTEASCLVPTNITNVNNLNNTNLYWVANNGETAWVVEYKEAATTNWNTLNVVNEPMVSLANLVNATPYDVRIKAVCDENNASAWANYQFTSDCDYTELPYVEDFERFETNTQPSCWASLNNTWPTNSWPMVYVNNSSTYVYNGSMSLYFVSSSTTPVYAIMPVFDAQNVKVTFFYKNEGTAAANGMLSIGTMTDPTNASTFVPVRTFDRVTTFTEESVDIMNLNGARIAFQVAGGTGNNYYIGVDDIMVEVGDNCPRPTIANVEAVSNTATVTITPIETATGYEVVCGETGFDPETATPVAVGADNTVVLTGLNPITNYQVYARAICSATEHSEWTSAYSFQTGCGALVLPFTENFEGLSTSEDINCWTVLGGTVRPATSSSYTCSGNLSLKFSGSSKNMIALPEVNAELSQVEMTFSTRPEGTSASSGTFQVGYVTDASDANSFVTVQNYSYSDFPGSCLEQTVVFPNAPAGSRIAFRHTPSSTIWYWFVDDIDIHRLSACPRPTITNVVATSNTATVTIGNTDADLDYEVVYGETGFDLATATPIAVGADYTVVLTGLNSASSYQVYARAICSATEQSDWSAVYSFVTGCGEMALPYTEDFESYTASTSISSFSYYPVCWDMIYTGTNQAYRPHVYNGSSYNPTNTKCMVLTSGAASYGSNNYVVLPPFNADLNNVQMSFKYRMESTASGKLYVGYMTDATNDSTFVQLADPTSYTSGTNYEMTFAGHNIPAGARIAFKWSHTSSYYSCGIDEIRVEQIPTCLKPTVTNVVATTNTATVTVGTIGNTADYEVVCGQLGFNPETATPVAVGADNTVVLTGLNPSSYYEAYARAICSATDKSPWSNAYNFQTECAPCNIPYTMNFDGFVSTTSISTTVFPVCWNYDYAGTSTGYGPHIYASSTYAHSGENALRFYVYKTTSTSASYGDAITILPEFSTDLNILGMNFYARKYSSTYASEIEVGVVTNINDPYASFVPVQTINPSSTDYSLYTVSFANYTGANGRIAFRVNKNVTGGTSSYNAACIDDITVEKVVYDKDIKIVSAEPIADACDLSDARVTIKVANLGCGGAVSRFNASYQVNDGAIVTESVTLDTPLERGEEYTYTFASAPVFTESVNNIHISVAIADDGDESNNTLTLGPISLLNPIELPYAEDFSDVVMGQGGWTVGARNDNPVMWSVVNGTPTYTFSDEYNAASYMVSPCLHIPAGQMMISYDYNALDVLPENLVVYVGTSDQPADWTVIGQHNNFTRSNNAYHVDYTFNNDADGIYYIIVKAASVRGSMGVTFDNLNIAPSYVVTVSSDNNGTTDPTGTVTVSAGDDLNINILPNAGYHVASIIVNGQVVAGEDSHNASVYPFTLENVAANTDVNVTFTANAVTVYKSVANHGHFVPATPDAVAYGAAHTVTAVADPHYHLSSLTVANYDGGRATDLMGDVIANGTTYTYTFNHVYSDKYVTASFEIDTVGIHYTVTGNGIVDNHAVETSASFDRYVDCGTTFSAMFVPAIGYHVAGVTINGVFYGNIDEWQFANLSGEQYVTVVFEKNVYTITTAGYGQGTVSDGETFEYDPEHTYTFTATPAAGYHIESILRNNVELNIADPEATYTETLTNILSDYNYNVVFNPSQYTVAATAGANGLITPAGVTSYYYNSQAVYNVTADLGYYINTLTVDGVSVILDPATTTASYTFTFTGENAHNHTIAATFARLQYTVTVNAGAHGTITPGTATYNYGATPTYTITPEAGYGIVDVTIDNASVGAVSSYTFSSLTGNHTIAATFAQYEYTIQASAGNGGTITPSGLINAVHGGTQNFTITPANGYHIAAIYVDGEAAAVANQYTFASIDANHTIHAMFEANTYTVTVNQPNNGVIAPGTMTVAYGATPTFVVTPNTGYNVTAITVNGSNVISSAVNTNGVYTYTMAPVTADATVSATMTQRTFTINATAGAHGTINGPSTVNYGANATYTITPAAGYVVDNVTVDGMTAGAVTSYTFTNVVANHTINATFRTEDCDVPTNMHTVDVTMTGATFMWYQPTATAYEVRYKAIDAAAYTTVNVNAMSYDVTGLTAGTTYVWSVRANCGNGNYSEWSNGNMFKTLEAPITPGVEDYDVNEMVNVYASHSNVYIVNEGNVQIDNVQIFDVYGKMVYNGYVSSNNEVISLNVATGAYMVRLTTDKGMATYKVVLTK